MNVNYKYAIIRSVQSFHNHASSSSYLVTKHSKQTQKNKYLHGKYKMKFPTRAQRTPSITNSIPGDGMSSFLSAMKAHRNSTGKQHMSLLIIINYY